jgi:predicted PurR-regulated permease PerM
MTRSTMPAWRLNLPTWLGLLALGMAFWLIINHAGLLLEVLWVLFGALLLNLAIRPLAERLARWRIPRTVTVLGVYAVLAAVLTLVGNLLAPILSSEVAHLRSGGPDLLQAVATRLAAIPLLGRLMPSADTLAQSLSQRLDVMVSAALGTAASIGGLALDMLLVLVLAYFFVTDRTLGQRLLRDWSPSRYRPQVDAIIASASQRLTRWLWAQVAIASYFALVFSVGLTLLGVPFAFSIGLVGGILEIIPYLGGAVAVSLAAVSALTVKPLLALWVILFYVVVVEIESHLVAPTFYGRVIGLHPVVVLLALVVGAKAQGVLGVFFAVPVVVVLGVIIQEARKALVPAVEGVTTDEAVEKGP